MRGTKAQKKTGKVIQKSLVPVTPNTIGALIVGFLLSMAISIYPLGTKYYQCSSTSIVSSGSYYARTKEICKQRAYSDKTEQKKSPAILDMTSGTGSESNKY
jgi:preprotein translocase subunit SecY